MLSQDQSFSSAMQAFSDVTLALSAQRDVNVVLKTIMEKSQDVMDAEASTLWMWDEEIDRLRFYVAGGPAVGTLESATIALSQGIAGWVAKTGEPLLIPDAYQDTRFDPSFDQRTGFRTRSILTVPLKAQDEVTGVVQVINKIGGKTFDNHDLYVFRSFAGLASVALERARLYEQARRLSLEKQHMGAYLPKYVTEEISRQREPKLALGGKMVRATMLFADIVAFTRLAESMEPQNVVSFLNVYMTAMTTIIEEEEGSVNKFIGDGMMAVFIPLGETDNHALRAVRSGMRMQHKLEEIRQDWTLSRPELAELQIRIGINTGQVVAGNIGSETRMDYTVVGDDVNVASRIESSCRAGEVCISEATYLDVQDHIIAKQLAPIFVKNRVQPVQVYAIPRD